MLTPNADADPLLTAVRTLHLDTALQQLNSPTRYSHAYQTTTRACFPDDITDDLQAAGLRVAARYGVRCVCDYLTDDDRKSDPGFYAQLEQLELALADRIPYLYTARFFHVIAVHTSPCQHRSPAHRE